MKKKKEEDLIREHKEKLKRFYHVLGTTEGEKLLCDLETHFQVHLPVFQGEAGKFDPLDAMRRDAYREVFLYCRHQLAIAGEK